MRNVSDSCADGEKVVRWGALVFSAITVRKASTGAGPPACAPGARGNLPTASRHSRCLPLHVLRGRADSPDAFPEWRLGLADGDQEPKRPRHLWIPCVPMIAHGDKGGRMFKSILIPTDGSKRQVGDKLGCGREREAALLQLIPLQSRLNSRRNQLDQSRPRLAA